MSNNEFNEVKIDYENGDIISIIHKWRKEPSEMSDQEFKQKVGVLYNQLLEKVPKSIKVEDKIDYVNQFFSILINPYRKKDGTFAFYTPSIIEVNSLSKVAKLMKKKMMKNNEPTKYEINGIVRAALRSLVLEGKISKQNKDNKDLKIISNTTEFYLEQYSSNYLAHYDDYLNCKNNLRLGVTKQRKSSTEANDGNEHTKLIAPKVAKQFVLDILKELQAPCELRLILDIFFDKIPELFSNPASLDAEISNGEGDDSSLYSFISNGENGDDYISIVDKEIIEENAYIVSLTCWEEIVSLNHEKLFCLYFVPKKITPSKKIILEEFGQPNRVSERVKTIKNNITEKIESAKDALQLPPERKPNELSTLFEKLIVDKLMQSCSENGYNVTL